LTNLPEIVKLARKYNANIMVDEATCTSCPWFTRRWKVPPMEITSSSGWGLKMITRLG
jgi:cystathionine beta-lyase/cystathionine gamma-synthase